MPVKKLRKDGKIAVIISTGYGTGWSTHNPDCAETLLFDAEIATAVLDNDNKKVATLAKAKCPNARLGGASGLCVEWVDKGESFSVNEYDGFESVHVGSEPAWTA